MAASKVWLGKLSLGIAALALVLGIAALAGLRAGVLPAGHHGLGSFFYLFAVLALDALALLLGMAGLVWDEHLLPSLVGMALSLLPGILAAIRWIH